LFDTLLELGIDPLLRMLASRSVVVKADIRHSQFDSVP
jgi:hypothetical protein